MPPIFENWEGQVVAGVYPLLQLLQAEEQGSSYATRVEQTNASIRIQPADLPNTDMLEARWRAASEFSHPNLIRIFAFGRSVLDGKEVVYVVKEKTDESLAEVLRSRPLTPAEVRDMVPPTLNALAYLHARGFVHGALDATSIMAAGDTLKLSVDGILPVGQKTPADDVLELGSLISEVLTLHRPEWKAGVLSVPPSIPTPFFEIVKHCCDPDPEHRWNLDQVSDALKGRFPVLAPSAVEATPNLVNARLRSTAGTTGDAEASVVPDPAPVLSTPAQKVPRSLPSRTVPERSVLEKYQRESPSSPERPRWLIPGVALLAVLLVAIAWAALRPKSAAKPVPAPNAPSSLVPPSSVPAVAPSSPPAAVRSERTPVRSEQTTPPAATPSRRRDASSWYVVVATYVQRDQAQKRANEISRKWPRFRAHVFNPPVEKPHHLVVIGANLSQDGAESLRKRARAAGLPRDIYIKRFPS